MANQTFWVYEDPVTSEARVHAGSCGFCQEGQGHQRGKTHASGDRWHGPFESLNQAKVIADRTGRRTIDVHSCCDSASSPSP